MRLALDALRYYAVTAGVDGFRFDLATTLGRTERGFDPAAPMLAAIAQDPVLRELKLVAEPWDVGNGGYRLGAFEPGFREWNDRYRDTARRFWRGDARMTGELATRIAGSADVFGARRRAPSCSVNFVAAHDGFTLRDLVSFERKHNDANGEDNRDGTDANFSWHHGIEGPAADPAIEEKRRRDVRSLLATLFISRGTPMLAMGDESGRTQKGNNNAYSQDNATSWLDWAAMDGELCAFVASLTALRRDHAALCDDRWLRGEPVDATGVPDVEWRHPDGSAMTEEDWAHPEGRVIVVALYAPATATAAADHVAIALNAGDSAVAVRWPDARDGFRWRRAIDTALPSGVPSGADEDEDLIAARSVVVLVEEAQAEKKGRGAGIEPDVLDRLARAAGIAPEWIDVEGRAHVVGDDTRRALLTAMGLDAATTGQARARLAELAARRERRVLPRTLVVARRRRGPDRDRRRRPPVATPRLAAWFAAKTVRCESCHSGSTICPATRSSQWMAQAYSGASFRCRHWRREAMPSPSRTGPSRRAGSSSRRAPAICRRSCAAAAAASASPRTFMRFAG